MSGTRKNHLEPAILILPKRRPSAAEAAESRSRKPHPLSLLLSLLAFIMLIQLIAVAHQTNASVELPPAANCTDAIRTTDYTQLVHLQSGTQEMGAVELANQLDGGQPAAQVQVTSTDAQHSLDVYIFGCTISKQHMQILPIFTQRHLSQGTVSISPQNTLVIGESDTSLTSQAIAILQPQQQNIYREYRWQNGAFVQVAFPSLYPVTSRSEAETLQQQASSGQPQTWSDPLATAEQMAKDLLKWPGNNPQDAVLQASNTTAQVQLVQQSPQITLTVTLERLIQASSSGLWFVVGAQTHDITLEQPGTSHPLQSPAAIKGTGALADGQTTAALFDHTLTPLTLYNNPTLTVDSQGNYSGTLDYTNNLQNQQGVLLIESLPPYQSSETGQVFLTKVILG